MINAAEKKKILSQIKTKEVQKLYKLPAEIKFCTQCTMSNQRPRITFDIAGVCSACRFAEHKKTIDFSQRKKELAELCDKHRKSDGSYDVIVPCSGGKDGGFVAHLLKYEYGMTPLTVTWSPNQYTEIGFRNLRNFIEIGGFDNILGAPNGPVNKKLARAAFIQMGDPFQAFIYGQTNFPLSMAVRHNVSLIMYGENGEVEYGGDMKNAYKPTRDITDHDKHYFSGYPLEFWQEYGLQERDLKPYMAPEFDLVQKNKTEIHFLSYYHCWDPQENFYYATEHNGFEPNTERSEGTYSKYASLDDRLDGMHYYLAYIKFGIGRATSDTAHEIRDQKIDRPEGVALVEKYDGEFPRKYHDAFLDYLSIDQEICDAVIDSWRAEHIWKKDNGIWKLRKAVWHNESENNATVSGIVEGSNRLQENLI